jgi:hypothetical protein
MSISIPATGSALGRASWQAAPPHLRRAGFAWLAVVGVWAAPSLVLAFLDPDSPSITAGWAGPATILVALVAVAATVAWGAALRSNHLTHLAVPSTVLGSAVVLIWLVALVAAWTRDSSDVNPEAVMFLGAVLLAVSVASIAAATAVGGRRRSPRG